MNIFYHFQFYSTADSHSLSGWKSYLEKCSGHLEKCSKNIDLEHAVSMKVLTRSKVQYVSM